MKNTPTLLVVWKKITSHPPCSEPIMKETLSTASPLSTIIMVKCLLAACATCCLYSLVIDDWLPVCYMLGNHYAWQQLVLTVSLASELIVPCSPYCKHLSNSCTAGRVGMKVQALSSTILPCYISTASMMGTTSLPTTRYSSTSKLSTTRIFLTSLPTTRNSSPASFPTTRIFYQALQVVIKILLLSAHE